MIPQKYDRINANTVRKDSVDGKLYLQSHWGSGVRYTVSSIVPEEPKGGV
ncbi:MAG: hypothetical protein IJF17_07410 [Thermoguttaceae bacterium]|nr:hypothetical protein [Thermoguttaceae bacterium]